jgi:Mg2+-importing ATPase
VVATGARTEFGGIAARLDTHQLDTEFQVGLGTFSMLLVYVASTLTVSIFVINVACRSRFSTRYCSPSPSRSASPRNCSPPSCPPASRRVHGACVRARFWSKRLVCIEDLGDLDVLFTDKTGTLTQGRIDYMRTVPAGGASPDEVLRWGLLCTEGGGPAVGGNPLDRALWDSPAAAAQQAALAGSSRLAALPFDHEPAGVPGSTQAGRGTGPGPLRRPRHRGQGRHRR